MNQLWGPLAEAFESQFWRTKIMVWRISIWNKQLVNKSFNAYYSHPEIVVNLWYTNDPNFSFLMDFSKKHPKGRSFDK